MGFMFHVFNFLVLSPHNMKFSWFILTKTFQSDCRINLVDRIGENYILKATLDEFDEYRMKKNMSDYMKWKEKVTITMCRPFISLISTNIPMFYSGGVLCSFSVGLKESEWQRCGHAFAHSSFHVQGQFLPIFEYKIFESLSWGSTKTLGTEITNVKLVQI